MSLLFIAIATGGIKSNVPLMGADQVNDEGPEMVRKFFDWFYWFIQVGALLAYTIVAYVQQEVSFFYGFLISAISIVCATILLLVGRKHYILHQPQESYFKDTLRIIRVGLRNKLCCRTNLGQTHWLDGAKHSLGGEFPEEMVEGVKSVVRMFPIFLTYIFYWTLFGQVSWCMGRGREGGGGFITFSTVLCFDSLEIAKVINKEPIQTESQVFLLLYIRWT